MPSRRSSATRTPAPPRRASARCRRPTSTPRSRRWRRWPAADAVLLLGGLLAGRDDLVAPALADQPDRVGDRRRGADPRAHHRDRGGAAVGDRDDLHVRVPQPARGVLEDRRAAIAARGLADTAGGL